MLLDRGIIVGVGYDHTLGLAGCAGGVDEGRHVLGEAAVAAGLDLGARGLRCLHAEPHEVVPEYGGGVIFEEFQAVVLEHYDALDAVGMGLPVPVGHRVLVLVSDEYYLRAAVTHDEVELRLDAA